MRKYRIVKEITYNKDGKELSTKYIAQKKLFGFLCWYDPFDDGFWSDGECNTYEEAKALLDVLLNKKVREIVYET